MTKRPDTRAAQAKGGRQQSISRRVIRLVLIPSVVALVLALAGAGYLVFNGYYARAVATSVREVSIPAATALANVQRERRLSIDFAAQADGAAAPDLQEQRARTDAALAEMRTSADTALAIAPRSITTRWDDLVARLDQLPQQRSAIDYRATSRDKVTDYYDGILDAATALFDEQARVVPAKDGALGGITATETFRVSDLMSRSGSIISSAYGARSLTPEEHREFVGLLGAYHGELDEAAESLEPAAKERYDALLKSDAWSRLIAAENELIAAGPWGDTVPPGLRVDAAAWDAVTTQVSDGLLDLSITQADAVSARTLGDANTTLITALLVSLAAILVAVAAIVWAVRQSRILVDRALSVRLEQLGRDAATMVDKRLPEMMERLRRREKIDTHVELASRDYGQDEIGRLADVLNRSLNAAVGAAVDEAATRAAGTAMLMGVARRPQRPLQRGLRTIEELQNKLGDEEVLAELFDVNHQLAQTRRFLENLVILAGGQIGRRFHRPVPLRRVLLGAIAETQKYRRVTLRNTPDLSLAAAAVAGTTHLLAELLDNALTFSPPESEVFISCGQASHGVVIEIEDAGVGMPHDALQKANAMLADAPTPDVTALRDGAQVGLWVVAELAKRGGIQVSLRTSAYGGLMAIVLLPTRLILTAPDAAATPPATRERMTPPAAVPPAVPRRAPEPAAAPAPQTPATTAAPVAVAEPPMDDSYPTAEMPAIKDGIPAVGGQTIAPTHAPPTPRAASRPPLPVRRPQEHLAQQLREEPPGPVAEPQAPDTTRSPEQARSRLSQYQRGWKAGRSAEGDGPRTDGDRKA
ncbi:sensor histidine kinase [Catenuloplanes atrovinosus]|uniref:histidine kinase n=1 Tax=Catenuloplanes atrovinosus TaxID=137266 RepID=A0AAE3YPD4_9ACTN|nr:nitrate- and nitrite sensing domain-containing protein [Catenuloplanes atrovinosus]MDR7277553.1 signal transduction histidine kinase [Catenuloplanes atrovinosus]